MEDLLQQSDEREAGDWWGKILSSGLTNQERMLGPLLRLLQVFRGQSIARRLKEGKPWQSNGIGTILIEGGHEDFVPDIKI